MKLGLVINPSAGAGLGAKVGRQVIEALSKTEHELIDLSGKDLAEAKQNAEAAISQLAIEVLVVVGGDGMAHLGVNVCAGKNIPLAIVPAGTGNDAAASLGISDKQPAKAIEQIISGLRNPKRIDAIEISHGGKKTWGLGSASAGFDALVNARANRMSFPKGPNRYYAAMLLELASFKPRKYSAVIDGKAKEFYAMLCAVSNTGVFGGGMLIVPDASISDGELDLLIVHKINRVRFLRIFPKVYKGTHVTDKAVEIIRAKTISIAAEGMPIYSDGEYVGEAPFDAKVVPGALYAIAPKV